MDVMEKKIRLDKYLADLNYGTRSEIKANIKKGQALVNGEKITSSDYKVLPSQDKVMYMGEDVSYVDKEYYMLNKPQNVVSATRDDKYQTVLDLIDQKKRKDLFPVGRLDIDTEGLLIITNDGMLSHQLLSPKKHVSKTYFAKVAGKVTKEHISLFKEGLKVDEEFQALPADLVIKESSENESEILLTICEGKFHQVKRMFEAIGCKVTYLKRISMGSLKLDEALKLGEYRPLTKSCSSFRRDWDWEQRRKARSYTGA